MKHLRLISLVILILFCLAPVMAQDAEATVESQPIAIVTEEAAAPVIVCEDGATCNVNEGDGTPVSDNSPLGLLLVVGGGFVGVIVALSLGLQVIGNRAQMAARNPLEIAVLEKAYESIPQSALDAIVKPFEAALERSDAALQAVLELLRKAGDRVPEASKPTPTTPYPPLTGTPLETNYTSTSTTDVGSAPAFPPTPHGS